MKVLPNLFIFIIIIIIALSHYDWPIAQFFLKN
jgi:hypothetical protein